MAPYDFWLFPELKMPLKGARFESREDIMRKVTAQLNTFPKKMRSKSVSNNGGTAGCITKGITLKDIRVNLFYMNKSIFANQRFDIF
jgi:hypothetical protein